MRNVWSSNPRFILQKLLIALKTVSFLTLGPILTVGHFGYSIVGGLFGCPFTVPFILCQICPTPCTFYIIQPWLFGVLVLTGLLIGRVFCGLLCPFGILSDFLFRSPVEKLSVSGVHNKLTYVKFSLLILFLYLIFEATGILLGLRPLEGFWYYLTLYRNDMVIATVAVVVIFLISSTFVHRLWCKYFCPIGTMHSISNRFSLLYLGRDPEKCGICDACSNSCPLGLSDRSDPQDCIRCLSCYVACSKIVLQLRTKKCKGNTE